MGKIITEKDFWMCTQGAMPAPLQGTRTSNKKEGGDEIYITVADTATLSTIDFGCTKFMLMSAIITAIVVVVAAVVVSAIIVATGGAALGLLAIIAIGAGGGLVGGVIGMVKGNMKCGQKNAQVRHWSDSKGNLLLTNTPSITSDHKMICDVGGTVMFAPNIKSWNDAYQQAALSYVVTFLECGLAGAGIGLLGGLGSSAFTGLTGVATLSQSVTLALPTLSSVGINLGVMGVAKGASGYNQYERGDAWGMSEDQKWDMAIPEREAINRIRENGYQSITAGDILLFGSDIIGPFLNIKTAPSVAAAEARAAAQAKANPELVPETPAEEGQPQGDKDGNSTPEEDGTPPKKEENAPSSKGQGDEAQAKPKDGEGNAYENESLNREEAIQSSRDAYARADNNSSSLPKSQSGKTTASDGINTVSGYSPNRISLRTRNNLDGVTDVSPNEVMNRADEINHTLNENSSLDNGIPGQASASHAEKQLMTRRPGDPIGVSKPMCNNCKVFAQKQANNLGQDVVVTDPDGTYIFEPGGIDPIFIPN